MKQKRKIAIIAGSRGEWGYFRPVIAEIERRKSLEYGVIVSNMHVLDRFGSSIDNIRNEGYNIAGVIHNTLDGYSRLTMAKSLSIFMLQLPEMLEAMGANIVLIGGDRGEQLMAAVVGAHLYLPVGHIQAGEVSGNIDGTTRHAITKFAHLHFAANADAAERVRRMGEQEFRIHLVGAPQLDDLIGGRITPRAELLRKLGIEASDRPIVFVLQHPVTEEFEQAGRQMATTLDAVKRFDADVVIIRNNSDAGSALVERAIQEKRAPNMRVFANLPREDFAGLLDAADAMVGNSSSGILEAPSFELPAVNIGGREAGRLQGANVINAAHDADEIARALDKALSPAFRSSLRGCENPYGDGKSAKRIVDILEQAPIDENLLVKRLTY